MEVFETCPYNSVKYVLLRDLCGSTRTRVLPPLLRWKQLEREAQEAEKALATPKYLIPISESAHRTADDYMTSL